MGRVTMTDYNLVSLFHTSVSLLNQSLMDYVSILFAFLIAGFFIADKLKLPMVVVVIVLFTIIEANLLPNMYFLEHDMKILGAQLALRVTNGDFALPGLVMTQKGGNYFLTQVIVTIGSYIGAIIFFFHQRRVGLTKT
jgi:hypothetical protein